MTKRMIIMLVAVGVLFGGLFGFKAFLGGVIKKSISAQGVPAQTVSTAKAQFTEWQGEFQAVGTLRAVRGADVAPELSGVITAIHFQSGQAVTAGAPLVQLNAESDLARLQSLAAAADLAQANYERDKKQLEFQAVSQAVVEADAATLKSARAQVAEQQALLNKKLVRAPFEGRLGIRAVDVGQYVNAGTKLVTLQALDPVYVDFYAPQKSLGKIALKQKIVLTTDAFQGQQFPGEVSSIDPKVDPATRNVQVRATVRNAKRSLLPGMFATVVIASGGPQRFLTLPQTAVCGSVRKRCGPRSPTIPSATPCSSWKRARGRTTSLRSSRSRSSSRPARRAAIRSRSSRASRRGIRWSPPGRSSCARAFRWSSTTPSSRRTSRRRNPRTNRGSG